MQSDWVKLPGLFYRWELEAVIEPARPGRRGSDFYVEESGKDGHGVALYRVHHRPHGTPDKVRN